MKTEYVVKSKKERRTIPRLGGGKIPGPDRKFSEGRNRKVMK